MPSLRSQFLSMAPPLGSLIAVVSLALSIPLVGTASPTAAVSALAGVEQAKQDEKASVPAGLPRAPAVTLPIRWRLATAVEDAAASSALCGTLVSVVNTTADTVNVEVEFHANGSGSLAVVSQAIGAFDSVGVVTDDEVTNLPWVRHASAELQDFSGYALVAADDPRIIASGMIYCRDGLGTSANLLGLYTVAAYPVGASLELFQARTSGAGEVPRVAAASESESPPR